MCIENKSIVNDIISQLYLTIAAPDPDTTCSEPVSFALVIYDQDKREQMENSKNRLMIDMYLQHPKRSVILNFFLILGVFTLFRDIASLFGVDDFMGSKFVLYFASLFYGVFSVYYVRISYRKKYERG